MARVTVSLQLTAAASDSPPGTVIPPATEIVDAEGAVWTLGDDLHGRGPVPIRNGLDVSQGAWGCWTLTYSGERRIVCYGGQGEIAWGTPVWGGVGEPPPPPPPPTENRAPEWSNGLPVFVINRQAQSFDLKTWASDPDGDPLAFVVVSGLKPDLEGAFHLDHDTFIFSYDGRDLGPIPEPTPENPLGGLMIDTGIVLEANDGR